MNTEIDWEKESKRTMIERQVLKERIKGFMFKEQVKLEARAFGTIEPKLAAKLSDVLGVSYDQQLDVFTGAREAILDLAARHPHLFGAAGVKQGIPLPRTGTPTMRKR